MPDFLRFFESFIGAFAAFFLFKFFLPGYFKQKSKNLADKQDIEELTNKIEGVKQQYLLESQKVNNKLSLLSVLQTNHRNEERNAIIHFYENYNFWLYRYFSIDLNLYRGSLDNISLLSNLRKELNEYHSSLNMSITKMNLLVKSDDILSIGNSLIKEIIPFHQFTVHSILELENAVKNDQINAKFFDQLSKSMDEDIDALNKAAKEEKEIVKEIQDLILKHLNLKIQKFKPCKQLATEFEEICKEYLLSIE